MSLETFYLDDVLRMPRFCTELKVFSCGEDDEPVILVFSPELVRSVYKMFYPSWILLVQEPSKAA